MTTPPRGPTETGDGRLIARDEIPDDSTKLKAPCQECPFRRSIAPGALGGSDAIVYVGQAAGPFWIPCHMAIDFNDPNWKTNYETPQCGGAAIFRANCGFAERQPAVMLQMAADTETVFASPEELVAHHHPELAGQSVDVVAALRRELAKIEPPKN